MKIGIFDPYLNIIGGGEKYMLTIASYLSKKHEVSLFWDNVSDIKRAQERFGLDLTKVTLKENIFSPKTSFIKKLSETGKYDVIIYLSDGSIPITLTKKLILHLQFPVEWVIPSLLTKLKLSRVDKIICNSHYTKYFIDRKYGKKSVILYPPVDIDHIQTRGKKENIIITVGRYNKLPDGSDFKKQSILVNAFKGLINNGVTDWKFVIVTNFLETEKHALDKFEKDIKNYPIELLQDIPNKKLIALYEKSKIYWHAAGFGEDLEKNPELAEHFGIATVEAMAAGCVPIVINAGGQKEIVEDGKNGFLWDSQKDLIEKTLHIISDEDKQKEISKKAITSAKIFSTTRFCEMLEQIIK